MCCLWATSGFWVYFAGLTLLPSQPARSFGSKITFVRISRDCQQKNHQEKPNFQRIGSLIQLPALIWKENNYQFFLLEEDKNLQLMKCDFSFLDPNYSADRLVMPNKNARSYCRLSVYLEFLCINKWRILIFHSLQVENSLHDSLENWYSERVFYC